MGTDIREIGASLGEEVHDSQLTDTLRAFYRGLFEACDLEQLCTSLSLYAVERAEHHRQAANSAGLDSWLGIARILDVAELAARGNADRVENESPGERAYQDGCLLEDLRKTEAEQRKKEAKNRGV